MTGVGMMQAAAGWIGPGSEVDEPEEVLAADGGYHIAGMPPMTALALVVALVSAFIAYQQAPSGQVSPSPPSRQIESIAPISIDEASTIVWRVVESDQG